MSHFKAEIAPNLISDGALHQTPLGELTVPPDPLAGLRGSYYREGRGGGRKGRGKGGRMGRKGRRGKGWGKEGEGRDISRMVVSRPWQH